MRLPLLAIAFLANLPTAHAERITGTVVKVVDGDTLYIQVDTVRGARERKIRLFGVDTPERTQAFGKKATTFTRKRVAGKEVVVDVIDIDRHSRLVGIVSFQKRPGKPARVLNELLLEKGLAWHYKKYDQTPRWSDLAARAKRKRRGLWRDKRPVPPWEFRAGGGVGKRGFCRVPHTGARPDPSVTKACHGIRSETQCRTYSSRAFPYRCVWRTSHDEPLRLPQTAPPSKGRPTCAPVRCRMHCPNGWAQGPDGCDVCRCKGRKLIPSDQ